MRPAGVAVTVTAPGAYTNSTGAIATSNGVTGGSASGTLNAFSAPTVTKSFAPTAIPVGGTATLNVSDDHATTRRL